ncbi:hypothetical protein ACT2E5_05820 [Burkholderia vietnamiensis]|uniref:hypothetical protein n=1 Tax=Burkholderia vietnamiensis TaxID=60552 RepID=UPI001B9D9A1E|nr:hypothetical protein [Burkholderia vietnamiensis]MBR8219844.1 hypothetical protein [Burkholderia vietnamiensis]
MPTVWENSYVDRLKTLGSQKAQVDKVTEDVLLAIDPLILPDRAKILVAIAADMMSGVQKRNNRADINNACAALQAALALLEAIGPGLDG